LELRYQSFSLDSLCRDWLNQNALSKYGILSVELSDNLTQPFDGAPSSNGNNENQNAEPKQFSQQIMTRTTTTNVERSRQRKQSKGPIILWPGQD